MCRRAHLLWTKRGSGGANAVRLRLRGAVRQPYGPQDERAEHEPAQRDQRKVLEGRFELPGTGPVGTARSLLRFAFAFPPASCRTRVQWCNACHTSRYPCQADCQMKDVQRPAPAASLWALF